MSLISELIKLTFHKENRELEIYKLWGEQKEVCLKHNAHNTTLNWSIPILRELIGPSTDITKYR